MSGFDSARIYSTAVLPPETTTEATNKDIQNTLVRFIEEFRIDNVFLYRDQLRENVLISLFNLQVDMMHLNSFDSDIWQRMMKEPAEVLPLFESAIRRVATRIMYGIDFGKTTNNAQAQLQDQPRQGNKMAPPCQLLLRSDVDLTLIRTLDAGYMSKLVRLPGIVIGASTLSSKATLLHLMCRSCRSTIDIPVTGGFAGVTFPRDCRAPAIEGQPKECGLDPYVIVHEKSMFSDQQTLKLQEAPDQVPVGELPRHIVLNADRYLTNKVVPGSRCTVMGIYSVYQNKTSKKTGAIAIRNPYLRVLGIQVDANNHTKMEANFTDEEEEEFLNLSRNPNLYEIFANSIAPSIYGNADIKKAVACLLLGGSKKILPDSMKLRGDINVLLLGDPGTAKSQILKFVEKVAPIAIYTSGKGSSAAGLTASVQRDAITREFFLEGGAMVLADGGVVCIDEFDKMRDEDRVAIHEAMEQQTISIAKAGITTILNSRTSVLAAANPIFGRYDDMKSPGDNIDFQTTILSRFDMIFIVKDDHNEARDQSIARHVMNIHMNRINADTHEGGEISIEKMKRYIAYCKAKCAPRLSPEASEKLSSHFVSIRKEVSQIEQDSNERSSIPITIRQLEAIIRISEALAKLTLSPVVSEGNVDEAIRLFMASTMDAVSQGTTTRKELVDEVNKIEAELRKRLPIGWSTSQATLTRDFVNNVGIFIKSPLTIARLFSTCSRQGSHGNGKARSHSIPQPEK